MRRARIKAVATVPVRRKATQDGSSEPIEHTVEKISEIDSKVHLQQNLTSDAIIIETQKTETVDTHFIPEKKDEIITQTNLDNISIVSVSEKKDLESTIDIENESQPKNEIRPVSQVHSPQKLPTIEGSTVKTMQNRSCFMRPTPRLDGGGRVRRNSIQGSGASASESEDDSRRSISIAPNRIRNDSVCSMQSLKDGSNVNNITKLNLGQKRRMVVSESARKLAEARREFLLKHEKTTPDKSKLTMYDLIYYNPVTNPMKPKPVGTPTRKISVSSTSMNKNIEEESVEEPSEMLVPQVKVGPNGELIIDEQSLVIDQYKAQDNIDRSDIIVDEDTTGSGFYRRRKKSKEWNKWETVKFYKALNTYGTDFLLMQNTFPTRTRQELKLKYKKEEKFNQNLIEKALQYQEFDTEALEKDLANVEENERKETELTKQKKHNNDSTNGIVKKKRRCKTMYDVVNCEDSESNKNSDEQSSEENDKINIIKRKRIIPNRKRSKRKRKIVKECVNDLRNDSKDNSDSEQEIYKAKPTRSGRAPRKTRNSQKSLIPLDNNTNQNKTKEEIQILNKTKEINDKSDNKTINDAKSKIIKDSSNTDRLKNSEIIKVNNDSNKTMKTLKTKTIQKIKNQNKSLQMLGTNSNLISNIVDSDSMNIVPLKGDSLVALKKDGADMLKTTLQVDIVSANCDTKNLNYKSSLLPSNMPSEVLETVVKCVKDMEPQNIP